MSMIDDLNRKIRHHKRWFFVHLTFALILVSIDVWRDRPWWAYLWLVPLGLGMEHNWHMWHKGQRLLSHPLMYLVALEDEFGTTEVSK